MAGGRLSNFGHALGHSPRGYVIPGLSGCVGWTGPNLLSDGVVTGLDPGNGNATVPYSEQLQVTNT